MMLSRNPSGVLTSSCRRGSSVRNRASAAADIGIRSIWYPWFFILSPIPGPVRAAGHHARLGAGHTPAGFVVPRHSTPFPCQRRSAQQARSLPAARAVLQFFARHLVMPGIAQPGLTVPRLLRSPDHAVAARAKHQLILIHASTPFPVKFDIRHRPRAARPAPAAIVPDPRRNVAESRSRPPVHRDRG